jgi:hypothetical protein
MSAESLPLSKPEAAVKVIHLVRNPVDIALSQMNVGWDESYDVIVQGLCDSMRGNFAQLSTYPREDVLLVHYEHILADTMTALHNIRRFLNLTEAQTAITPEKIASTLMLSHDVAADPASTWRKRSIDSERRGTVQHLFNTICPDLMQQLYSRDLSRSSSS